HDRRRRLHRLGHAAGGGHPDGADQRPPGRGADRRPRHVLPVTGDRVNVPGWLHTGVPRRLLLGGLAGTSLLAFGGVGSGAVPNAKDAIALTLHLTWMHDKGPVQAVCTVLVFLGMLLLVWCWWPLRSL